MTRLLFFWLSCYLLLSSCAQPPVEELPKTESSALHIKKNHYPKIWWNPIEGKKKSWEIAPDSVKPPQVILSKRNSLGLLSNFADTPFMLDEKKYASLEGLWQSTKYPEHKNDPRWSLAKWPHTRKQVEMMVGFDAKRAGDFASKIMKKNKIDWVSYKGQRMEYREPKKGEFYQLIVRATKAKIAQNESVKKVLQKTRGLVLLPDHRQGKNPPPAWKYFAIYMELRDAK